MLLPQLPRTCVARFRLLATRRQSLCTCERASWACSCLRRQSLLQNIASALTSVNDEGEKEGWCMPWDEAPGLDDARVPELRNILKAHNKACAQKVRRAEILQDQNWHNEVKAADRERKQQKRAMKQKEKQ